MKIDSCSMLSDNRLKSFAKKCLSVRDSSLGYLYIAIDMLRESPRTLYYVVSVILGLGLARFTNASVLAYVMLSREKNSQVESIKKISHDILPNLNNADSLSIIGGPVFPRVPVLEEAVGAAEPQFDYTVLGTIAGHPSFASVVVNLLGGEVRGTKEYGVGGKIGFDRIAWIGRGYIVVRRGEQKITINVGQNALTLSQESIQVKENGASLKKTISRQDASKLLKNPAAIYVDASFGPVLDKGQITGYKIFKVKSSHLFYKLGARGGDIIRKVNGFELKDTERMFELWKSMKTTSDVSIDLERNGKILQYDLKIIN